MTKDDHLAELETHLRTRLSPDFARVSVGKTEDENGMRHVFLLPKRLLTHAEVVSSCREVAPIIRATIPEKSDGWAVAILVERIFGDPMGIYFLGWSGHDDEWRFSEPPTDHTDWQNLFRRLSELLASHAGEKRDGEEEPFFLRDQDNGLPKLTVSISRIELLTASLVESIQELLESSHPDWSVEVRLFLSPSVEGVPLDGIEIRVDEIVEYWDREHLRKVLGDRLKI